MCVCTWACVSCVATGLNVRRAGWAVLKTLGRGAVKGFDDNLWIQREGESVCLDRLEESGYAAQSPPLYTLTQDFLYSTFMQW